jgi:small-conductance mechanosensitive channel
MLERYVYGNTVFDWLIAAIIALVAGTVLVAVRAQALRWVTRRSAGAHAQATARTRAVFAGTRPWFLIAIAVFIGAQFVDLPRKADRFIDHLTIIAVIAQIAFWASMAIRHVLERQVAAKRETDAGAATTVAVLGFFAQLALWSLVVLLALENLGFNITTLLAGLGIGGIAMALAAQGVLGDIFASITIVLDKPFAIGDFITADNVAGTVEYVGLKTTRLRSISGEQIIVSNTDLLKSRVRNFKRLTERRVEFTIGVSYAMPAAKLGLVPTIMREAIEDQPQTRFDRAHFKQYGENALIFEAAFYFRDPDYNRYMDIQQAINLAIYGRLQQEGIVLVHQSPPAPVAAEPPRERRDAGPPARASLRSG